MKGKHAMMLMVLLCMASDGYAKKPPSRVAGAKRWQLEQKGDIKLKQVAVGAARHVWGRDLEGYVYKWNGTNWDKKTDMIMDWIAVGADGSVVGISKDDAAIYQFIDSEGTFKKMTTAPAGLKCVSIAKGGLLYGLGKDGSVYAVKGITWKKMPGKLDRITASADGNVWGLSGTTVYQWQKVVWWRWIKKLEGLKKPGGLKDISAGGGHRVWGIGMDKVPYRWTYEKGYFGIKHWQWVRQAEAGAGNLVSISVGADGDPWVIDNANRVGKWVEK